MKIELSTAIPALLAAWYFIKRWYNEISKVVEPLVAEVEKRAIDGVIDKSDRKALVMKAISSLEAQGKIKLNFISRFIVSKIVDMIAAKLPDFTVTKGANELLSKVAKK